MICSLCKEPQLQIIPYKPSSLRNWRGVNPDVAAGYHCRAQHYFDVGVVSPKFVVKTGFADGEVLVGGKFARGAADGIQRF